MAHDKPERIYFELPSGDRLPLPFFPWEPSEFSLPGNSKVLAGGRLIALYDETSRTGAVYFDAPPVPFWKIVQPCVREDFFRGVMVDEELLLDNEPSLLAPDV